MSSGQNSIETSFISHVWAGCKSRNKYYAEMLPLLGVSASLDYYVVTQ